MAEDLLQTALRVLSAYLDYGEPNADDVRCLRQEVSALQSSWEADELARFIVRRELARRELPAVESEWLAAMAEMNEATAEVSSAVPSQDGQLRLQKAEARHCAAYAKYLELLKRRLIDIGQGGETRRPRHDPRTTVLTRYQSSTRFMPWTVIS